MAASTVPSLPPPETLRRRIAKLWQPGPPGALHVSKSLHAALSAVASGSGQARDDRCQLGRAGTSGDSLSAAGILPARPGTQAEGPGSATGARPKRPAGRGKRVTLPWDRPPCWLSSTTVAARRVQVGQRRTRARRMLERDGALAPGDDIRWINPPLFMSRPSAENPRTSAPTIGGAFIAVRGSQSGLHTAEKPLASASRPTYLEVQQSIDQQGRSAKTLRRRAECRHPSVLWLPFRVSGRPSTRGAPVAVSEHLRR